MFTSLLSPTHLIIVMVVALLFLGPKRLPGAGRALGQGLKEFKHSIAGVQDDLHLRGEAVPVEQEGPSDTRPITRPDVSPDG
jgi:sec-independent protein translocase protein TatA